MRKKHFFELIDKPAILSALKKNGWAIIGCAPEFKNDLDIALEATKLVGSFLKYLPDDLKRNRQIVLNSVKSSGISLEFAPQPLRDDFDIVLEAVTQNGWALGLASERLRADKKIIAAAIKQNPSSIKYAITVKKTGKYKRIIKK